MIPELKPALPALFIVIALGACSQTEAPQAPPTHVSIATPAPAEVTDWDEFTGRLAAVESVDIRARVSGYLESVDFKEGAMVEKDDLLVVIDPRR